MGVVTFLDFANLTGGTLVDTFTFDDAGSISGTLDGGTGNDIADYSQLTGLQTITVGALPGAGTVTLDLVNQLRDETP